ncbi:MAG: hypothetical protein P8K68_07670 [Algibacter sp.]|uniref:hypothetical protein n=1 Tax=Algibacter sp. TaxID=1872428 RepID=UPI002615F7A8|nr:hypothetical protein [Algibacter sp.]MDG1729462.1 hypothetical protein [Algibacter sp.]MDG2178648.1 hypothetical protein [Algibacter sp.]
MEILIYQKQYHKADAIENFLDFYYNIQLNHLASNLLKEGLSPEQISDAVLKAINVGKSSGLEIQQHFMPVFTDLKSDIINDCKLSKLGYGLVLLNADTEVSTVGQWQIKVLEAYFD